MKKYHTSVLLEESVSALEVVSDGVYADATYGGGGHSREILKQLSKHGRLISFDQDTDVFTNLSDDARFLFVNHNFRYLKHFLDFYSIGELNGLIADLGVSSHHFDEESRGFSFRFDSDLDMRMNSRQVLKASDIIMTYDYSALAEILRLYGGLSNAGKLAGAIISFRSDRPILKAGDLVDCLKCFAPRKQESKFYAKVFQAFRIVVNDEVSALQELLLSLPETIRPGGRVVFISYHSVEDRLVKNFIKSGNLNGEVEKDFFGNVISPFKADGGVIVPDASELEDNPRSRSAKMRVAIKL